MIPTPDPNDRRQRWGKREADHTLQGVLSHYGRMAFETVWKLAIPLIALKLWQIAGLASQVQNIQRTTDESVADRRAIHAEIDTVRGQLNDIESTAKAAVRVGCVGLTAAQRDVVDECPTRRNP